MKLEIARSVPPVMKNWIVTCLILVLVIEDVHWVESSRTGGMSHWPVSVDVFYGTPILRLHRIGVIAFELRTWI